MGKIIVIYEALLNRKEKICSREEIIEIIKEYNASIGKVNIENALWYLSRHNYIKRIMLNLYYINSLDERERNFCNYEGKELLFMALSRLKIRWYLALNNALYLLGKTWQTPNKLVIINNRISGKKNLLGMDVRFIKIKESLIFGLTHGSTRNNIPYFYSDLAKTYLDLAYFRDINKNKIGLLKALKETKAYLKKYPKWLTKLI